MTEFKKAEKKRSLLRCALFGPSGSGKTMTALRVASGMHQRMREIDSDFPGQIGVIDSERGTSELYGDMFDFIFCDLEDNLTIEDYLNAMEIAAKNNINPLIIDSGSHAWQELLTEIDHLTYTKFRGNSWQAWSVGTPKQKKLVRAIQSYPGHMIWTMRSKTEWLTEKDDRGKTKPVRIGLSPEQGKGIEYEFSLLLELSPEHFCTVLKDRTHKFQDKITEKPGEKFGIELIDWLYSGKIVEIPPEPPPPEQNIPETPPADKNNGNRNNGSITVDQLRNISDILAAFFLSPEEIFATCQAVVGRTVKKSTEFTAEEGKKILNTIIDDDEADKYIKIATGKK